MIAVIKVMVVVLVFVEVVAVVDIIRPYSL